MTPEEHAALVELLKAEWHFFRERLASWEAEHMPEEGSREWDGHVAPPLARLDAEITRLSEEVERLKGQGWQPRETAPKDGSEFIAGSPGWASFSAQWRDGHFVHIDPDDGWIVPPFELWCPLPTPPASQEGQADA